MVMDRGNYLMSTLASPCPGNVGSLDPLQAFIVGHLVSPVTAAHPQGKLFTEAFHIGLLCMRPR